MSEGNLGEGISLEELKGHYEKHFLTPDQFIDLVKEWHEGMERISFNGEFLFELKSKQQWAVQIPGILPEKIRGSEQRIWIDKNGNVFECGADFMAAEDQDSYPCRVYRVQNVASVTK